MAFASIRPKYVKIDSVPVNSVVVEGIYVGEDPSIKFPLHPGRKIRQPDGSIITLSGCGTITKNFANVDVGSRVRVINTGSLILEKGNFSGKMCHTADVQVWAEETPEQTEEEEVADGGYDVLG